MKWLHSLSAAVWLACGLGLAAAPPARPNIVLMLADDLGWSDLGCYGADLHETPRLDGLAGEGVRFTHAYAMSVCSPTRAAILTGKHAARLNFTVWREASVERAERVRSGTERLLPPLTATDLPHSEVTLAEVLKAQGYLTFHVGKWHLGDAGHSPETQGFDLNIGGTHWGAPATYFHPFSGAFGQARESRYVPGLGLGQPGDYLTDRLTDEALKLIDAAGDRPFFLNLWFHSPHTPIEGKPALVESFRQKLKPGLRHQNPAYAAMVRTLDENVGRVLDHLASRGIADRTLVVFMSDNGGYLGSFAGQPVNNNAPLRSGKGSLYEGGIRVPLLVRMPGWAARGVVCSEPVICMDLFRTLAEAGGAPGTSGVDGMSLVPLLRDPTSHLAREELCFHYPHYYATTSPVGAIRAGDWKLMQFFADRFELYNLRDDPGEQQDLASSQPERVRQLRNRLESWQRDVGAQMPTTRDPGTP